MFPAFPCQCSAGSSGNMPWFPTSLTPKSVQTCKMVASLAGVAQGKVSDSGKFGGNVIGEIANFDVLWGQ